MIRKLFRIGLIRGHEFCTVTKIIFKDSPSYEFAKKVYDYKGKHKNLLLTTVRHAVTVLGPGVIKTLIFYKGYWDGKTLYKLKKQYGIDFMIPAKKNFRL